MPCTPALLLGPFYPVVKPDGGASTWLCRDDAMWETHRAALEIALRVQNRAGQSVGGACVEVWHADPSGRYRHGSAPDHKDVLDEFVGYGAARTGDDGRVTFRSLMPGPYSNAGALRAPHIHVQVTGRIDRLVTQMFFPGDPHNATDRWYRAASRPEQLLGQWADTPHAPRRIDWTIVIAQG